jgi:hypothetical protein
MAPAISGIEGGSDPGEERFKGGAISQMHKEISAQAREVIEQVAIDMEQGIIETPLFRESPRLQAKLALSRLKTKNSIAS